MKEYIITDFIKEHKKHFKHTIKAFKNMGYDILNDDSIFAVAHHLIGHEDEKISHRMLRLAVCDGRYIDKENLIWEITSYEPQWLNLHPRTKHCILDEFDYPAELEFEENQARIKRKNNKK